MKRPPMSLSRTKQRRRRRAARVFGLALIATGFIGTGALAYWSTTGTGTGTATAGTLATVTVDQVIIGNQLYPGGPNVDVTIQVKNSNTFPVTVFSMMAGPITSDKLGCGGGTGQDTGVTLDLSPVAGVISAGTSTTPCITTFTAHASMDSTSVSACQSARFSSALTLVVHK